MSAPEELDGVVIRDGLLARPGDVLLLRVEQRLSMDEFDAFVDSLRQSLPESIQLCLIHGVADWDVVRPEVPNDAAGSS